MKWILVIVNGFAAVVMFGSLALVPYAELTGLRTEAFNMERAGVLEQESLERYLGGHNALVGRLDRYDALARYLYDLVQLDPPFRLGACITFAVNMLAILFFWRKRPDQGNRPTTASTVRLTRGGSPSG